MIRAFVMAARSGSFRSAAAALSVTPSSVSQHIKGLEAHLGTRLFDRGARRIELTEAGHRLAQKLDPALAAIDSALSEARSAQADQTLRISALPLFTSAWLIPRLDRFKRLHPDIQLEIDVSHRLVSFADDPVDIAIRNASGPSSGLDCIKLFDVRALPMCTPVMAGQMSGPADLLRQPLIHLADRRDGWATWLAASGVVGQPGDRGLVVDTLSSALDAAAHGQGVMLAPDPLVWLAPQADRLVAPFATPKVPVGAYFAVCRRGDAVRPQVRAFLDWLRREVKSGTSRAGKRG